MSRLVANRAFRYAGRELSADEEFEAESKDVLVLTSANNPLARAVPSAAAVETRAMVPQGDTNDQLAGNDGNRRRRYGRRDMRAEEP